MLGVLRIVAVARANRQSTETPGSINPLASSDVAAISACSLSHVAHRAAGGELSARLLGDPQQGFSQFQQTGSITAPGVHALTFGGANQPEVLGPNSRNAGRCRNDVISSIQTQPKSQLTKNACRLVPSCLTASNLRRSFSEAIIRTPATTCSTSNTFR